MLDPCNFDLALIKKLVGGTLSSAHVEDRFIPIESHYMHS